MMLRRYSTLGEAQIVRSLLMSNGIYASIGEEHQAAVAWCYVQALGGVTVRIAVEDYEEAKNAIRFAVASARSDPQFSDVNYETPINYRWAPFLFYWMMEVGLLGIISSCIGWAVLTVTPTAWWPDWDYQFIAQGKEIAASSLTYTFGLYSIVSAGLIVFYLAYLLLFLHLTKRYYRDRAK